MKIKKYIFKTILYVFASISVLSCSSEDSPTKDDPKTDGGDTPATGKGKAIVLGYFPSWSETWVSKPTDGSKLRNIPKHVTHVFLAFAKPNLRYVKGSFDITKTGIQTPYKGKILKESIAYLKARGTKVVLSIGGETYWNDAKSYDINYQQIKDLVDDLGLEGIDWDFEPAGSFATIGNAENVQRFISFFKESRKVMPKGKYLLACAPAGVGVLGGLNNDDSASPFSYAKRNKVTGESDTNLYKSTVPNKAISLFGFATTGHMIPVLKAVGKDIDLIAYQGYNTGAASNRKIMYDAYKYYSDIYGFSIAAGIHFPNEPWGPYYTYTYKNTAELSKHIASKSKKDGVMIWQLLLKNSTSSSYSFLNVASKVLGGTKTSEAIKEADDYKQSRTSY